MHLWNKGYTTDINYTRGYYGTLNPLRIKLLFLAQKLLPPQINTACELGFGQGITLNFNGTSANAHWYGTDFNSSQAFFAKNLANISKAPLHVFDDSFEEFLKRDNLPQFDFIALHGIYAWVSAEIREQILEFLEKKLNVGGVCLISYNCQAGWASVAPFRNLISTYSQYITPLGKLSSDRVKEALDFVNAYMKLPCSQTLKSPKLDSVISTLSKMDSVYLAHELLNEHHTPFNFVEMAQMMGRAKLEFASYANFSDHLTNIQILPEEKELLMQVAHDRAIYEMVKDLIFATSFRSDYWARGVITLSESQALEELLKLKVILTIPYSKVNYEIKTYRGNFTLNQTFYKPILKALSSNEPTSVLEVKNALEKSLSKQISFQEIIEALIALSSKDYIKLVQEDEHRQKAKEYTQNLNKHILKQSSQTDYINYLISPVTGEAIHLNRFEMMFVYAFSLYSNKDDQIKFVADLLKQCGDKISKDDRELTDKEILAELEQQRKNILEWVEIFEKLELL